MFLSAENTGRARKRAKTKKFSVKKLSLYDKVGKRLFDLLILALLSPVVVPLIAALAFVVWLDGGKPFYSQARVGRGGHIFKMWKIRTMVHDADQKLEAYLASNEEAWAEWQYAQKLRNDPRITRAGRLLRAVSLDELPQLWNVFRGEMSLVGPRPFMDNQADLYHGKGYFSLRPGLTGAWQVSERNESSFAERVTYDDRYLEGLSFREDLRILMATVRVVLVPTGV